MKKLIFTIFIMFVLVMFFVSCGWKVEIVDPTKPIENDSELVASEDEPEEPEEIKEQETEEPSLLAEYIFLILRKRYTTIN